MYQAGGINTPKPAVSSSLTIKSAKSRLLFVPYRNEAFCIWSSLLAVEEGSIQGENINEKLLFVCFAFESHISPCMFTRNKTRLQLGGELG